MNKVIKFGLQVTKVLIWNRTEDEASSCELTFSDNSIIYYECESIIELENENKGIYELLPNGNYKQIEDWEN